jgi:transposase
MNKRKSYSKEFKEQAVRLAEQNSNTSQTARDLGIHQSLLRTWKQQFEARGTRAFPGSGHARDEELVRLRKELKRLEEENAILKKAVGIFSKRPG